MKTEKRTSENVNQYLDYLKKAFSKEPEQMTAEQIDEAGIRNRVADPFYSLTKSLLAFEEG